MMLSEKTKTSIVHLWLLVSGMALVRATGSLRPNQRYGNSINVQSPQRRELLTTFDIFDTQNEATTNNHMGDEEGVIKPHFISYKMAAVNTTMNATDEAGMDLSTAMMDNSFQYEGGAIGTDELQPLDENVPIQQSWNFVFVVFAYVIACVASYSAVHLMDHALWRAEELKKAAIIKHPDVYAAFMLGFGAVWCMHYVGMAAVTLEGIPICYDWGITMGSLGAVLVMMLAALKVAQFDIFATPDRQRILNEIVGNNHITEREVMWSLARHTYFYKLHHLFLASFLAASGAIVMHYTGMMAQQGPFRREWSVGLISASVVAALVICFAGFWIIFRLRWKIKQLWLRYFSAGVIAFAVCFLHFFGMLSVTYYPDNNPQHGTCESTLERNAYSPNAWTYHQIIVLGVGIAVPACAFYISNTINQELIIAYEVTAKSNAIVSSMFPGQIRDRMFADDKTKLKSFLAGKDSQTDDDHMDDAIAKKPIADLFTDTTIMFADIAGFTSWSSEREPSQVFTLLETIYKSFDDISQRHGIFKVETVGDCYVAVSGLPEPRKDHAVVMAKVASRFVYKMSVLTKRLEMKLGPDTGDLNIRIGLHSGSVTAGVLRGERARFQLFGDTMNLASRMESTGMPGRIQTSTETAEFLKAAGKAGWVTPRDNEVYVKGKGDLQTYWVNTKDSNVEAESLASGSDQSSKFDSITNDKNYRLIEWNVDVLVNMLKQIVARRNSRKSKGHMKRQATQATLSIDSSNGSAGSHTVLDEVCEIIELPAFESDAVKRQEQPDSIVLPTEVVNQLRGYVGALASRYEDNPFHNFEHASHVTMSVSKLLSRIVAHSADRLPDDDEDKCVASTLHDHTYGITSDPLTQFACVLSALMHDVEHQGVPNTQLVKEGAPVASKYERSIAEQNSVDIAWELLMDDKYKDLRATIYSNDTEMKRFRQLIVNSVMATDIMDKDLKKLRNARWEKAFAEQDTTEEQLVATNRKATIVIEHLIQASDVAHTMQHWHVFLKWNERLFQEMHKAYMLGRSDKDPAEFWYKGEIGFFDFYIIPLAKKLKDCGVFGVASDEYLNYAIQNRREWEQKGVEIVRQYIVNAIHEWDDKIDEDSEHSSSSWNNEALPFEDEPHCVYKQRRSWSGLAAHE